jgi:acyl-CoA synthetase
MHGLHKSIVSGIGVVRVFDEEGIMSDQAAISLPAAVQFMARGNPTACFVVGSEDGPRTITLAEAFEAGRSIAGWLAREGCNQGDCIALLGTHDPEYVTAVVAGALVGARLLLLPPHLGAHEIAFALREMRVRFLLHSSRWRNVDLCQVVDSVGGLDDLEMTAVWNNRPLQLASWLTLLSAPPLDSSQVAADASFVIYSSGTTSEPKGIIHQGAPAVAKIRSVVGQLEDWREGGIMMAAWPAGTIGGIHAVLRFLVGGQNVAMMEHWHAATAARLIESLQVDYLAASPIHVQGILDAAGKEGLELASLRGCALGGAPVRMDLVRQCEDRGIRGFRAYGSSEHPFSAQGSIHDPVEKRMGTEGRPAPGAEIRIIDEEGSPLPPQERGEIISRGPELFVSYSRPALNAAAFTPEGWYRTGDVGYFDEDGHLVVSDRIKDVIIRGGENISAEEVEAHLRTHPAVADVAVVAAPDPRYGEIACAFVVLVDGASLSIVDIERHFRDQAISLRKMPERLEFIRDIPRNILGKILKAELRNSLEPSARLDVSQ